MMYKLIDGKLVEAPIVWKGIVGYNKNLDRLVSDGWKPKITTGDGSIVSYIEHADHIEEKHSKPKFDYRQAREAAYPSVGDMIDAFCKAYAGDDTELKNLMAKRDIVKATIKKEKDAD